MTDWSFNSVYQCIMNKVKRANLPFLVLFFSFILIKSEILKLLLHSVTSTPNCIKNVFSVILTVNNDVATCRNFRKCNENCRLALSAQHHRKEIITFKHIVDRVNLRKTLAYILLRAFEMPQQE